MHNYQHSNLISKNDTTRWKRRAYRCPFWTLSLSTENQVPNHATLLQPVKLMLCWVPFNYSNSWAKISCSNFILEKGNPASESCLSIKIDLTISYIYLIIFQTKYFLVELSSVKAITSTAIQKACINLTN